MVLRTPVRRWRTCLFASAFLLSLLLSSSAQTSPANFEQELAAARSKVDPQERIAAFRSLSEATRGATRQRVRELLLETLLAAYPERTAEVHEAASSLLALAQPGFERWAEQARLAGLLATAGASGADLPDAKLWAQQAVDALTESNYRVEMARAQKRFKLPPLPAVQQHENFVRHRAAFLGNLAEVNLRVGNLSAAEDQITQAYRLDPLSGEVNQIQGELELKLGHAPQALIALERADALGGLSRSRRGVLLDLYRKSTTGEDAGLETAVDRQYQALYPAPFTLPRRKLTAGGRTVLLELFSGAGCLPCVGPDLALESLLTTYGPEDLVALQYDEHIPRPDPLANPDTVARASAYGVQSTPEAFLDGEALQVLGSRRSDVENIVVSFADEIESEAAEPAPVHLSLTTMRSAPNLIRAELTLTLAAPLPQKPDVESGPKAPSFRTLSQSVLHLALVQDHVRYSGENGVRFHRMVVRSLQEVPIAAYLGNTAPAYRTSFDLDAIERSLNAYLETFEANGGVGSPVHFKDKPTALRDGKLAVVAWLQSPRTREVYGVTSSSLP